MPSHSFASFEAFRELLLRFHRGQGALKGAGKKGGTVFVRHGESLLFTEMKLPVCRIVGHITAGGLGRQPLPNVALGCAGLLRELSRSLRSARGKSLV